ncbi:MAG TPA: MASE1 domain-containing protein [Steroidobacter sp.]|uniref:MASE1 domain-containing protein n=1 Tax=Steroidobacter sp. TaxID=1978227 RepID=UPI002ED832E9
MPIAIGALLLAVSYFLGVHAGFALTSDHAPVALLWPPNAVLLSALLLSPKRAWPILIAVTLPAHLLAEMSAQVPMSMVLLWFVSNVTEALIGAFVIRGYLHRAPQFDRFHDLIVFLIGAVLLGAVLSSFLDTAFVAAIGWRYSDFWTVYRTRLLSNVLATLTLAPLILHLAQAGGRFTRRRGVRDQIEIAVLLIGLWGACALVFLQPHPDANDFMRPYMILPLLVWAAMRLSVSGLCLCMLSVAAFAISGLLDGRGPFAASDPAAGVVGLQLFLIISAVSLLLHCVSLGELRNAQQVAVQHGERLQLALSAARMGIWDWEVGSQRLMWSNPAYNLAGQALQYETSMTRMLERIHPDDRAAVSAAFADVANGADHLEVEFRWSGADDRGSDSGWASAIGKVSERDGGRRLLGVHVNVSERKNQEFQVQQQLNQISHLSRVAMLGELSGALAHELSQPLTAILANAQAARRWLQQGAVGEIHEVVDDIIAENKRASEVIRRLRALFARGTADSGPVDVNECVRDVLSLAHSDLVARNIMAEVRLAANLPDVWADRIQLQQVLLNLILNACDAMRENNPGERYLRISTRLTEEGEIGIEVCDRGTGIGDLEKIFEPFYTTKQHGLGLGLAICQTIVGAHRGRLWASNNSDRGATIHIILPLLTSISDRRIAAGSDHPAT